MAGIYFHIPFCKVKCSYCDFYKTTNNSAIGDLVKALKLELWIRRDYLGFEKIETIYFGGGTPSLLSIHQIEMLLGACKSVFKVDHDAEITFEANPDDLTIDYLSGLLQIGINRISIGIQSFSPSDLKLMKRRHNPSQATGAVQLAIEAGFTNISVDLIYGVPNMPFEQWQKNLEQVFALKINHLSAYHLTYHQGTTLYDDLKRGKISEIDEDWSVAQFDELVKQAKSNGFIHYEISNFALDGFFSRHNSAYWKQTAYLGLGPSAHSYCKDSRQWNVASLNKYLDALMLNEIPFTSETLSLNERYNDYVITSLRTMWGIDLKYVESEFGHDFLSYMVKEAEKYINSEQLIHEGDKLKLAHRGMLTSDAIMSDLMIAP
jgi:oxygen-independent coproporphyrinogen III oxidase